MVASMLKAVERLLREPRALCSSARKRAGILEPRSRARAGESRFVPGEQLTPAQTREIEGQHRASVRVPNPAGVFGVKPDPASYPFALDSNGYPLAPQSWDDSARR